MYYPYNYQANNGNNTWWAILIIVFIIFILFFGNGYGPQNNGKC